MLRRFTLDREQAAFEILMLRHGPLVWDVCRHILRDTHYAEDAFQATFLVLARKVSVIRKRESVGSWLYGVALRVAARARHIEHRRRTREQEAVDMFPSVPDAGGLGFDERAILHKELQKMPAAYRTAVILCHMQG